MAGQLSDNDRELIKELLRVGVFQNVEEHRLSRQTGVMLVVCSDGDRFLDTFGHQARIQKVCQDHDPRIHTFAWHGGALTCAPKSPLNKRRGANGVFLDQISAGRALKQINTVALYAHAPCGAANACGLSLTKELALYVRAKDRIRKLNGGIEVVSFFHVDYGNGRKRTYFFSRKKWEEWLAARQAA